MSGRPEIPGGESERVRLGGGAALRLQLATLCAGHPLDRVLWALTQELASVCLLAGETLDEAKQIVDHNAADIKNLLELNWDDLHAQAVAESAALSGNPGAGRTQ